MLINFFAFNAQLSRYLDIYQPPYAVIGNELLLIDKTSKKILTLAKKTCGYSYSIDLNDINQWQELLANTGINDLISGQACIIANIKNTKLNKIQIILEKLVTNKSNVIFILPKLDKTSKQSDWFKYLTKHMLCIECPNIDNNNIKSWLKYIINDLNLNLDNKSIEWLESKFIGNALGGFKELQRLSLAYGNNKISLIDVQKAVLDIAEYQAYEVINSCISGNIQKLRHAIKFITQDNMILVIWLLIEEISLLIIIQKKMQVKSLQQIFNELRIWGEKEDSIKKSINRLTLPILTKILQEIYSLEKQAKGVEKNYSNLYDKVYNLCMKISLYS